MVSQNRSNLQTIEPLHWQMKKLVKGTGPSCILNIAVNKSPIKCIDCEAHIPPIQLGLWGHGTNLELNQLNDYPPTQHRLQTNKLVNVDQQALR